MIEMVFYGSMKGCDDMRIIKCDNYEEISRCAAGLVAAQVILKPNSVLGLATGSTPIGMYERLCEMYKNGELDFSEVTSFNLDEYYPLRHDNDQSYHYFMNKNLFESVNIRESFLPDGEAADPAVECDDYERLIASYGGIDLQILGIGQNGHIGFNEPGERLSAVTHLTKLTQSTIAANSRFFASEADVPTMALTMGMATIMSAKKIVLLANGASKSAAVKKLLDDDIDTKVPATMLKMHPDVVLICDGEALGE